jgi:hypothetical protein
MLAAGPLKMGDDDLRTANEEVIENRPEAFPHHGRPSRMQHPDYNGVDRRRRKLISSPSAGSPEAELTNTKLTFHFKILPLGARRFVESCLRCGFLFSAVMISGS